MDIWKWIEKLEDTLHEAGQDASIRTLEDLSSHVCDLEIARAEALLPEAKALAKSLNNPWLEVFIGHWEMRNRLGANMEGETALPDMVALFERAHRADAIDCPQSVCVTQDLGNCYANIDGPGWANERRAVVEETLQRIDPSWSCFICLSVEYADILYDEGRYTEGLAWLNAQEAKLKAAGTAYDEDAIELSRAEHLMGLNQPDMALALLEAQAARAKGPEWENVRQARSVRHAHALAMLERDEEAWQTLPEWDATSPRNKTWWISTAAQLLKRTPERNTWQFGSRLQAALDHYSRHGAHRPLVDGAIAAARLALARGAQWSAQRLLTLARKHQPQLRADAGAAARLDALQAELARQPAPALPTPANRLMAWLETLAERNPEQEAQWLLTAQRELPEDQNLLMLTSSALNACGAFEEAEALLQADLQRRPQAESDQVAHTLLSVWLHRGETGRIKELARRFESIEPPFSSWCRARLAEREGNWAQVVALSQAAIEQAPWPGLIQLLAVGLRQQKHFAEAAATYQRLAGLLENPRAALWDHMTCATAAGDWQAVRASAKKLEIELDSNTGSDSDPIEEDWGWIIIRYIEEGTARDYYARRTGPVTASILENAVPGKPQHVLDQIVFDASYLEDPPEDEAERKEFTYTYGSVHTLKSGGYGPSWLVEGVHPGKEALKTLIDTLEAQGHQVWVHSSDYEVRDTENDNTPLPAVLFTVASPQERPALELHKLLQQETQQFPHKMCWLHLVRHCNLDASEHEDVVMRYGL
jgi:hypothetical protein